jgi:plasmid stability protein
VASLTLKNVPDDLLRALREAADGDRRSLNQEIIHLLTTVLGDRNGKPATLPPKVKAQVAAWRKLAGKWQSDLEPMAEGKQVTARRSGGRKVDL